MLSIGCVQGQAEGLREQLVLIPISEGIPQDILESFGVQESQEDLQDLHLTPDWEQSTPLFSGEMREFLLSSAIGFLPYSRSFKLFLFLIFMEHLLYFLLFLIF